MVDELLVMKYNFYSLGAVEKMELFDGLELVDMGLDLCILSFRYFIYDEENYQYVELGLGLYSMGEAFVKILLALKVVSFEHVEVEQ
jgi:hypothetical protein